MRDYLANQDLSINTPGPTVNDASPIARKRIATLRCDIAEYRSAPNMGFNCGIVGLPNVGKSTLFNAVTRTASAQAANYPFCTIEPNVGRVGVPDERLDRINAIVVAKRVIPTFMEFVDIAGLVKGASRGEGLGNQFLGHIRQVDAIVHVVRCFEDGDIVHVDGDTDPARDIDTINTELIYADFESVNKSYDKLQKSLKSQDKKILANFETATRLRDHLTALKPARSCPQDGTPEEQEYLQSLHLITIKPVLYAANVGEDELASSGETSAHVRTVREIAAKEKNEVVVVSARLEEELGQLDEVEAKAYMESLGVQEAGLSRLIRAGYQLLNLNTYFSGRSGSPRMDVPEGCQSASSRRRYPYRLRERIYLRRSLRVR